MKSFLYHHIILEWEGIDGMIGHFTSRYVVRDQDPGNLMLP